MYDDGLLNGPRLNLDGRFAVLENLKQLFCVGGGFGFGFESSRPFAADGPEVELKRVGRLVPPNAQITVGFDIFWHDALHNKVGDSETNIKDI